MARGLYLDVWKVFHHWRKFGIGSGVREFLSLVLQGAFQSSFLSLLSIHFRLQIHQFCPWAFSSSRAWDLH